MSYKREGDRVYINPSPQLLDFWHQKVHPWKLDVHPLQILSLYDLIIQIFTTIKLYSTMVTDFEFTKICGEIIKDVLLSCYTLHTHIQAL